MKLCFLQRKISFWLFFHHSVTVIENHMRFWSKVLCRVAGTREKKKRNGRSFLPSVFFFSGSFFFWSVLFSSSLIEEGSDSKQMENGWNLCREAACACNRVLVQRCPCTIGKRRKSASDEHHSAAFLVRRRPRFSQGARMLPWKNCSTSGRKTVLRHVKQAGGMAAMREHAGWTFC